MVFYIAAAPALAQDKKQSTAPQAKSDKFKQDCRNLPFTECVECAKSKGNASAQAGKYCQGAR
ncbi:MAG: hypothetical protein WD039_10015 [Xanthobacteraceae bacterium]